MPYADKSKDSDCKRKWAREHPEQVKDSQQKYVEANREKVREASRIGSLKYYWADPERTKRRVREWELANPEKAKIKRRLHVFAKYGLVYADIEGMQAIQGFKCKLCSEGLSGLYGYEIDHVVPVSRGGATERSNLQLLCVPCNRGKSHQTDDEYIQHCLKVVKANLGGW